MLNKLEFLTPDYPFSNSNHVRYTLIAIGVVLGVVVIANVYTWSRIVKSLIFSQRRKLLRIIGRLQSVRAEGYLQVLKFIADPLLFSCFVNISP